MAEPLHPLYQVGVERGRAEERAAYEPIGYVSPKRQLYPIDVDPSKIHAYRLRLAYVRTEAEPEPHSDHGLTVSDIAAHLRAEIAKRKEEFMVALNAEGENAPTDVALCIDAETGALVDTLTWLTDRESAQLDEDSWYEPAPSGDD